MLAIPGAAGVDRDGRVAAGVRQRRQAVMVPRVDVNVTGVPAATGTPFCSQRTVTDVGVESGISADAAGVVNANRSALTLTGAVAVRPEASHRDGVVATDRRSHVERRATICHRWSGDAALGGVAARGTDRHRLVGDSAIRRIDQRKRCIAHSASTRAAGPDTEGGYR